MKRLTFTASALALALLILCFPGSSRADSYGYVITIPGAASFPTTTLSFFPTSLFSGSQTIAPGGISVNFNGANWLASVTDDLWNTTGGGTYFTLTCNPLSPTCLNATGGSYTYEIDPDATPAPSSIGTFALNWYVEPGIPFEDQGIIFPDISTITPPTVPEPSSLLLFIAALLAIAVWRLGPMLIGSRVNHSAC